MLFLLAACTGADDPTPPDSSSATTTDVTWYRDIEPISYAKCAACHDGTGVGPGDWTSYEEASAAGDRIAWWVDQGEMPLPASDPECRTYAGHERMNLTDEEIAALVAWGDGGTPLGDEADQTPDLSIPVVTLTDTDTDLPMFEAHTLQLNDQGNEYWCQVLDNPFEETTYITGIDVDLGDREVVHHMVLAIDQNKNAGIEYGTDGATAQFECSNPVVESDWLLIHAWTPGMEPVEFAEGQGYKVEPDQQIVLQMHYFGDPAETYTDLSTYRFRTTDSVDQVVEMGAFGPTDFQIAPGDGAATATDGLKNTFGTDIEILGAFPHMHLLGSHFRSWVASDDTEICVLDGRYDFDHQMTYMFEEPVDLKEGDRLKFECTWDNSAGTETVSFGEGTDEEMCFLLFYYTY
ncbi:MAG: c-type cytochrome [Proteobacteria bacterium]|nr:c-type cytochrome [Pseudomonadota bacterium]